MSKELRKRSIAESKAIKREVYAFIVNYIKEHVYPPSNKEICEALNMAGTTAHRHIAELINEGLLETDADPGAVRAIRVAGTHVTRKGKRNE